MTETEKAQAQPPVTIKKYANRRLYNTASSSYVTLDHLCQMVKDGVEFQVFDAKSGEDITRSVLTQIIVEEEGKGGQNLLPIGFLRQLIAFYGDNLQSVVPRYLEMSMQSFSRNQEQFRQMLTNAWGGLFPFNRFDDLGKQNMAFFENAMKVWSPFHKEKAGEMPHMPMPTMQGETLDELQGKLDALQKQVEALAASKRK
jgi:polyhydroxyalkanoate synthesis repressor PhaR